MKTLKSVLTIILAVALFLNMATAQTGKAISNVKSDAALTVKYLGFQAEYLLFQVEIKTGGISRSILTVNDKSEGELYAEAVNTNSKMMTIKIEKLSDQVLDFRLFSGKSVYSRTFTAHNNTIERFIVDEKRTAKL